MLQFEGLRKRVIKNYFIIIITTVTFTIIQLIFYIQYTLTANKSTTSQVTNVSEIKDEEVKFTTINDELKVLDNSYISDANYIGDRWKVKIVLVGNSDQITNSLNKLKNMEKYTINEYNIDGKKGNIAVELDLIRKK